MASSSSSLSCTYPLGRFLTCSVCMNTFADPVTAACGHSFCTECQDGDECPLCEQHVGSVLKVNFILRDMVQQMKANEDDVYTGKDAELPCDICTLEKRKAQKSCLMCLASYCSAHLENHHSSKRLKGHKLVAPVKNLDERACLKHGRPLELYTRKQQRCICVGCLEEDPEDVVSAEVEWDQKKAEIDNSKMRLKENIEKRKTKMVEINSSFKDCMDQLDSEWWDIDHVFTAIIAIVEEAQADVLKPLTVRRQKVELEAAELNKELESDIRTLDNAIGELTRISALEDHILFLQRYPSLPDLDGDVRDVECDTSLTFGTFRKSMAIMMEHIQQELEKLTSIELKRVSKFSVDVKLDPARQCPAPERSGVSGNSLALSTFTSGRSYWEVDVSNKTSWDLGLAKRDNDSKGKVSANPDNGYRVTVHYNKDGDAAAPPVPLYLREKPEKVGVFVDYEDGVVSFYNLKAQSHIHSFTGCCFTGDVFPYFGPHVKNI